jgi:hypothetical protein
VLKDWFWKWKCTSVILRYIAVHCRIFKIQLNLIEDGCLLFCRTMYSDRSIRTFQRCFLPPSSGRWWGQKHLWNVYQTTLRNNADRQPSSFSPPWEFEMSLPESNLITFDTWHFFDVNSAVFLFCKRMFTSSCQGSRCIQYTTLFRVVGML